jgi:hypothetical protein
MSLPNRQMNPSLPPRLDTKPVIRVGAAPPVAVPVVVPEKESDGPIHAVDAMALCMLGSAVGG